MQDGVLNLARVKLRDQQRLAHGPLKEYSQFGEGIPFGDAVPRAGNDSGGGQPGRILKCKGWETDPNAYIYFITQAPVWEKICDVIGEPTWKTDANYAKPPARLSRLNEIFARIEQWTMTKTKFEAMDILNKDDIPCGPILSMKEIAEDQSLRATGTVVEVDHPTRGKYISVGNPIKLSDSPSDVTRSPLLGEHTDEILRQVSWLQRSPGRRNPRFPARSIRRASRRPNNDAIRTARKAAGFGGLFVLDEKRRPSSLVDDLSAVIPASDASKRRTEWLALDHGRERFEVVAFPNSAGAGQYRCEKTGIEMWQACPESACEFPEPRRDPDAAHFSGARPISYMCRTACHEARSRGKRAMMSGCSCAT